jgi:hypothetical protein
MWVCQPLRWLARQQAERSSFTVITKQSICFETVLMLRAFATSHLLPETAVNGLGWIQIRHRSEEPRNLGCSSFATGAISIGLFDSRI